MSRYVLPDGRSAVLVPRDRKHFSKLQGGYPLTEEFLDHLSDEGIDAISIDDGERIYAFDLLQYRRGDRVGHAPYPMKRVTPLADAARSFEGEARTDEVRAAEWEWLTEADLRPARERSGRPGSSSDSRPREAPDDSLTAD